MTPQQVRIELGKLPEPHRTKCLEAFEKAPQMQEYFVSRRANLEQAIMCIDWAGDTEYFKELIELAEDGEFDTPAEYTVAMVSISEADFADYQRLKGIEGKLNRFIETLNEE